MKKILKIFFISLGSLILLACVAIAIVCWIVFTPSKLTPIVNREAAKFLTCQTEIENVELTFFSSFPTFGLKTGKVLLVNHIDGVPSDTLLLLEKVTCDVDIKALWNRGELNMSNIQLINGRACIYSDSLGQTNYDIFPADEEPADTTSSEGFLSSINLDYVSAKNLDVLYVDDATKLKADVQGFSGDITATIVGDDISVAVKTNKFPVLVEMADPALKVRMQNFSANIDAKMIGDSIRATVQTGQFPLWLEMDGEKYLDNVAFKTSGTVGMNLDRMFFDISALQAHIANLPVIALAGTVEMPDNGDILLDLDYDIAALPVKDAMALIPESYKSYTEGIDIEGLLSSSGSIKGVYNDTTMPMLDLGVKLADGKVRAPSMLPFPLHAVNADATVVTDLSDNIISALTINSFSARTPKSSISTRGKIDHLFTDIRANLNTTVALDLAEFNSMIPAEMKTTMKGKVSGTVATRLTMAQVEQMAVEKMYISGKLNIKDLNVVYDSITVVSPAASVNFTLPNPNKNPQTGFLAATIVSDDLKANMIDGFAAALRGVDLTVETSNVMDTTVMPTVRSTFAFGDVAATMDTIAVTAASAKGRFSFTPDRKNADKSDIGLTLASGALKAAMGQDKYNVGSLNINADVAYDAAQKEMALQFIPRGTFVMNNADIAMSDIKYPINIPSVDLNFSPKEFNIKKMRAKIGDSDFSLTGNLNNFFEYMRGDSVLRGEFDFSSPMTNIDQLMILTSDPAETSPQVATTTEAEAEESDLFSGPYMIPKNIDVVLHTNIARASYDNNIIKDITGDVKMRNGVLVLGGLDFAAPGANVQVTAFYRPQRKNHIFIGADLHLMDVEIADLVSMFPTLGELLPMINSFGGQAEFHAAFQAFTDSTYKIKTSMLHGGAAIKGENLVLMDGETFTKIANTLFFKKKTENKIDSMSVEVQVNYTKIEVYPFVLTMDKYKAVVAGQHNTDMTFDYMISLLESPLPFRVGVKVSGNIDDLKFRFLRKKKDLPKAYIPVYQGIIEPYQLDIKQWVFDNYEKKVRAKPTVPAATATE